MPRDFINLSKRQQKRILSADIKKFEENASPHLSSTVTTSPDSVSTESLVGNPQTGAIKRLKLTQSLSVNLETIGVDGSVNRLASFEASENALVGSLENNVLDKSNSSFSDELRQCFLHHNISHTCVNDLLQILRTFGHKDIPNDARTFLRTPRSGSINIVNMCGGQYIHFGLVENIRRFVLKYNIQENNLKMNVGIDGLPLTKSSGSQFWPILGDIIVHNTYTSPFIIGCFHGYNKPSSSHDFLMPFVHEYQQIQQNGLEINGQIFTFKLNCFITDTPARAFILNIKSHSGYFGCSKCICEGDYVERRVIFLDSTCSLRTNESFRQKQQPEHHHGSSVLENLDVDMVDQFPLDYMHLVLLGVTKRILCLWFRGNKAVRLTKSKLEQLEELFVSTRGYVISDFSRKPRSMQNLDRWKATEFRLFLLYIGPVILRDILSKKAYNHFLALSVAIRILCSKSQIYYDYAHDLLSYFVQKFGYYFGQENLSFNVHNLLHLTRDVKNHGPLDLFSAFKFESKFYRFKQVLQSSRLPLQQLYNRVSEEEDLLNVSQNQQKVFYKKGKIFKVDLPSIKLSLQFNENCCQLIDEKLVIITKFIKVNNDIICFAKYYTNVENFFVIPCRSELVGIFKVHNSSLTTETVKFNINKISAKCLRVKFGDSFIVVKLLH